MAYTLILTAGERRTFDWVGDRYSSTGNDVANLLCPYLPYDREWSDDGDITFNVSENISWDIDYFAKQENYTWPCFAPELAAKMQAFCNSIV
jgi:hypothetical protein